jgi:hypothetical protein
LFFAKKQGHAGDVVALIHSHHLLDHKPDNMILKAGKFKLRGVGCLLVDQGVALCIGPQAAVNKFRSKLKAEMPQKKCGTIDIEVTSILEDKLSSIENFEEATLEELRSLLASMGHEEQFLGHPEGQPSRDIASLLI